MADPPRQFNVGPVVLPQTHRPRPVVAYTGAIALVVAATSLRAGLAPWIRADQIVFVTFFPALFIAAWILGPKPTLLATALSALSADFFFITPPGTFGSKDPAGYFGIAILILCGIAIAILAEREHRARVLAEFQAEENAQLRDLAEEAASQAEEEAERAEDETQRGLLLVKEREQLIAELEHERTSLQAIVKYLPVGLVMRSAASGEVTFVNGQVEQLLGVLPGPDTWRDAITTLAFRRLDGSPIGVNDLPLSRVLRDGTPVSEDVECTRADGRPLSLHFDAGPVKDAHGTVTGGVLTMLDVTERRRTEEAVRFLAEASTALGVSLDYEATLATVARLAVPVLADWCSIDLAEPDGTLRRIAITHTDASREAWAWELERRFPATRAVGGGAYEVLDSGESAFVPVITPEMIAASGHDPEYIRIIGELGLASYIGVPLAAHGQVFGVLSFVTADSSRQYTAADLRLAEALGQRAGAAVDIARRHRETVEGSNMLAAMLTASPVGQAFVDRDLCYVAVNPALAALHGVTVDAHLGRPIRDVLPAWADQLETMHRQVFATGQPVLDRELTLPMPGGGEYRLMVNCFPVRGAGGEVRWVGVTKADVTERRRNEQALRTSEARLRGVVESPLIGIGFYDRDGRVTSANGALTDLLGYTREEIANGVLRWDSNLTAPECRYLDEQASREVQATGTSRAYEKELIRKDGTRVPVLAGASRLSEDGHTGVFYILDLTERRRVTEQVQAAQRLEAVGRLAGGVAHEINNALQGVLGFNSFILKRLEERHPVRSDAEQVQASGERAARITQQLLAYSRRQVLQQKDVDLAQVVTEFAPMLRQALGPDRELALVPASAPAIVHADRSQLEQVLLNLTLNARDAMPAGGRLTIRISRLPAPSRWSAVRGGAGLAPGNYVQLTVQDDGVGMDAATRARVFEPFFTTKPVGQGTGLGLSVVHGIVQQSGGHVWLYGEPGEGTTVTILLPEAKVEAATVEAAGDGAGGAALVPSGGNERILVVDDEPVVLAFVGSLLRDAGYQVFEAAQAESGLELFTADHAHGGPIDLVLTDLIMPGMGGRAFGEALSRIAPRVPILFSSGYTDDEVARRGLLPEGAEFVPKPFSSELLLQRIRHLLDRDAQTAAS